MTLEGAHRIDDLTAGNVYDLKMVFNDHGAIIFPNSRQHQDMKATNISYQDNYAGNALAAMLRRDAVEIRFHAGFSDDAVRRIVRDLLARPEFAALAAARVTYQGRDISP